MNNKTKHVLPAFAAIFGLMFVAATPYVLAEPGEGKAWTGYGDYKHAKKMHNGHIKVMVEGFTGSICEDKASKELVIFAICLSISGSCNNCVSSVSCSG